MLITGSSCSAAIVVVVRVVVVVDGGLPSGGGDPFLLIRSTRLTVAASSFLSFHLGFSSSFTSFPSFPPTLRLV